MDSIPNELWSDQPPDHPPPEPEAWVDRVADHVELSRLCNMNVLVEGNDMQLGATNTLTTKFVYDWRLKDRVQPDGSTVKAWLRRSRLVARECILGETFGYICTSNQYTHPQCFADAVPAKLG
jgi:hypothetical protein